MSIVLFGGSFDPVHKGHINLINHMFSQISDIEVFYIIPTGSHPELKKYLFTNNERMIMLKASIGQLTDLEHIYHETETVFPKSYFDRIVVSDYELKKNDCTYTIDTILHFQELHKNTDIHLLVGADQSQKFSTWYQSKIIAQLVNLWVYPRKGYTIDNSLKWNIIESPEYDISSTEIKQNLLNDDFFDNTKIPPNVNILMRYFMKK